MSNAPMGGEQPESAGRGITPFQKAFLWTAVPQVVLSLLSTGGVWLEGLYLVWFLALLIWGLTLLGGIIYLATGERQTAAGIFAGFAVGFVALSVTCFANLNALDSA